MQVAARIRWVERSRIERGDACVSRISLGLQVYGDVAVRRAAESQGDRWATPISRSDFRTSRNSKVCRGAQSFESNHETAIQGSTSNYSEIDQAASTARRKKSSRKPGHMLAPSRYERI
jgi:hypothetical protein